ncbi:hypothetical protein BDW69DRAFT_190253 [Aspergillus filifer]
MDYPEALLEGCPSCLIRIVEEEEGSVKDEKEKSEETPSNYVSKYRTVAFDHSSVREFLSSTRICNAVDKKLSLYYVDNGVWNAKAAIRCLEILVKDRPDSVDLAMQKEPMLSYAASNWASHATCSKPTIAAQEFKSAEQHQKVTVKACQLFSEENTTAFLNWLRVYDPADAWTKVDPYRPLEECADPLYYAAFLGLEDVVEALLNRGARITSNKGSYGDAFVAVAVNGHVSCLQKMVKLGYKPRPWTVYHIAEHVRENAAEVISFILTPDLAIRTAANGRRGFRTDRMLEHAVRNF